MIDNIPIIPVCASETLRVPLYFEKKEIAVEDIRKISKSILDEFFSGKVVSSPIAKAFLQELDPKSYSAVIVSMTEKYFKRETFFDTNKNGITEIEKRLEGYVKRRRSLESEDLQKFMELFLSHIKKIVSEIEREPPVLTDNKNRAISIDILLNDAEDFVEGQIKDIEVKTRIAELSGKIYAHVAIVDNKEMDELLSKITKKYLQLFDRFKEEADPRESPFSSSIIYTDYHHPVSGWMLESSMMVDGEYNFRLAKQTSLRTSELISLLVFVDKGKITYFAPGNDIEKREEYREGILMSTQPIPGRLKVVVIDPLSEEFQRDVEEKLYRYAEREYEVLSRIEEINRMGRLLREILNNKKHPKRSAFPSDEDIKKSIKKIEEEKAGLNKELEIGSITVDKLELMIRERVVAIENLPSGAFANAGAMSFRDLGLSSPLDLLHGIDKMYPIIEQLLLKGKFPDKIPVNNFLFLPRDTQTYL